MAISLYKLWSCMRSQYRPDQWLRNVLCIIACNIVTGSAGFAEQADVIRCYNDHGIRFAYTVQSNEVTIGQIKLKNEAAFFGAQNITESSRYAAIRPTTVKKFTIPSEIEGMPVTRLGACAFMCCSNITSIVVPSTVREIGPCAFMECPRLLRVELNEGLKAIQWGAFAGCTSLLSIHIPQSVNDIDAKVFNGTRLWDYTLNGALYLDNWFIGYRRPKQQGDPRLIDLKLQDGTWGIASGALLANQPTNCLSTITKFVLPQVITNLVVPSSVMHINKRACNCSFLSQIELNSAYIGKEAFAASPFLEKVIIGPGVTAIDDGAFSYCGGITNFEFTLRPGDKELYLSSCVFAHSFERLRTIRLPEGVSSIQYELFTGCKGLQEVYLPMTLGWIDPLGLAGLANVECLVIPPKVKHIKLGAFNQCSKLKAIYFLGDAPDDVGNPFGDMFDPTNTIWKQLNWFPRNLTNIKADLRDDLTIFVVPGSRGWAGTWMSAELPKYWPLNNGVTTQNYRIMYSTILPPRPKAGYTAADVARLIQYVYAHYNEEGQTIATPIPSRGSFTYGTCFLITQDGYALTCEHVVKDGKHFSVMLNGGQFDAVVVEADSKNDVALLKIQGKGFCPVPFSSRKPVLGERVYTLGYPNISMQGKAVKYTEGVISSLTGLADERTEMQISVPIQPGNSGGPLFDMAGNVIGIVASRLGSFYALKNSGMLPENVNYAVKIDVAISLIHDLPVESFAKPHPLDMKAVLPETSVGLIRCSMK